MSILGHVLVRATRKMNALVAHGSTKLRWVPLYLRFKLHGHGHAWRIFTHMTPQERLLLYRLGLQQPGGATLLEVGSYLGASACFLAAAAKEIEGGEGALCGYLAQRGNE